MSFSSERKNEILLRKIPKVCCRRSLLLGALVAKGNAVLDDVTLRVGDRATAAFLCRLIKEFYAKDSVVCPPPDGGRGVILLFSSPSAARTLDAVCETGTITPEVRCDFCRGNFLSGIFLVSGSVSDPEKQYCLELSVGNSLFPIETYLKEQGLEPHVAHRRTERVLSFRNAEGVGDFLAMAGLQTAAFAVMNTKIEMGIRAEANRISNSETSNIEKAVLASHRQLTVIGALSQMGLLSSLPPELEATARLRLENPHLSLSSLAALTSPPISKPGLSHRLTRLLEVGEEMLRARGALPRETEKNEKKG